MSKPKVISNEEKLKVAKFWGRSSSQSSLQKKRDFYSLKPIQNYMLECVSDGAKRCNVSDEWFNEWAISEAFSGNIPIENCLSICCGFGENDRVLAKMGVFKKCVAIDISDEAVAQAKLLAENSGIKNIEYVVADITAYDMGLDKYDLVYAGGALHHIDNLELVFDKIFGCLKPGGVLISSEYVGPAYNNLSDRHRELINAAAHLLPKHLRHLSEENFVPREWRSSKWRRGLFEALRLLSFRPSTIDFENTELNASWAFHKKIIFDSIRNYSHFLSKYFRKRKSFQFGQIWDNSPEAIRRGDPSEGIRADEIIPILQSRFNNPVIKYFNGSILHYVLDAKFFSVFDEERDGVWLNILISMERDLIAQNEIPPILAAIVARK